MHYLQQVRSVYLKKDSMLNESGHNWDSSPIKTTGEAQAFAKEWQFLQSLPQELIKSAIDEIKGNIQLDTANKKRILINLRTNYKRWFNYPYVQYSQQPSDYIWLKWMRNLHAPVKFSVQAKSALY